MWDSGKLRKVGHKVAIRKYSEWDTNFSYWSLTLMKEHKLRCSKIRFWEKCLALSGRKAEIREINCIRNLKWRAKIHTRFWCSIASVRPIYKKNDKTDCSDYRRISLLLTMYKILSNTLLPRLTQYAEEIIGDHQCGFRSNRSTTETTDPIFCILSCF